MLHWLVGFFVVALVLIGATQVVLPMMNENLPFFWLFRKKVRAVSEAREELTDAELDLEVERLKNRAEKTRNKLQSSDKPESSS